MRTIKTYCRKKYSVTINTWYYNPITVARAYNLPDDEFEIFDIDKFFYEFEKEHGILNVVAEDSENGSVVRTGQFAFNKVMKAHNTKLPIALREGPDCVVSNSYQVFEVIDEKKLLPKYLLLWI